MVIMKDASYAVMNLRILRDNIAAYASYAPQDEFGKIYEKIEEAQRGVDGLIEFIEKL